MIATNSILRHGLVLAGTVSTIALSSPAWADCALTTTTNPSDTLTCSATTSSDTTAIVYPSTSRANTFNAAIPNTVNITGAVDGFGIAAAQAAAGTNQLTFGNFASVTVNAGNTPTTSGGNGAVRITSTTAPVYYLGNGAVSNRGIGDGLQIATVGAAAPVTVATAGAIAAAAGDGINLSATGAGSTITGTFGTVTTTGAGFAGVRATTTNGAQTYNTGTITSAGDGLIASSTTGNITANVTGNLSASGAAFNGIHLISNTGTTAVNVSGGNVTNPLGQAIETSTDGAALVSIAAGRAVSGQIGIADASTIGNLTVSNGGTLTGSGFAIQSAARTSLVNSTSGTLTGALALSAFDDTVTNSGTFNLSGVSNFGTGSDTFANNASVNVVGLSTLTGLESFTNAAAGTLNIAAGSALAVPGATLFSNAGRINAEAGAAAIAVPTFTNAATGIIDLQDGAAGDITTITGNYTGAAGSRLLIDANADLSAADRLVVTGNIGGSTTLGVNYLGTASTFNPAGVIVVDGNGTTATNSFILDPASVNNGLLTYRLNQNGADYVLASNFNAGITGLAPLASMGTDLWYQSFDAYHDGIAGRHGYRNREGNPIGVWANLYWSHDKRGNQAATTTLFGQPLNYSSEIENHRRGAQGGIDLNVAGFTLGVTGGYERNKADNGSFSNYEFEGHNYGAYAMFGSEAGIYGGAMYKRDNFHVRYGDNTRGFNLTIDKAHTDGVDGELGFRTTGESIKFDLNAGLSWVKTKIDPITLYGAIFHYDGAESMRGRLGARAIFPQLHGAFLGGKVFHEFKGNRDGLTITSGANSGVLLPEGRGTVYRVEGGLGADAKSGPVITVWGDFGDSKGMGVRAGFRF